MKQDHYPLRKGFNDALGYYVPRDDLSNDKKIARAKKRIQYKSVTDRVDISIAASVQLTFDPYWEI